MSEVDMPKSVVCSICGAWADLDPAQRSIGWNMRDVALCHEPPIERCPRMRDALATRRELG